MADNWTPLQKMNRPYYTRNRYEQIARISQGRLSVYENYHKDWLSRKEPYKLNLNQRMELYDLNRRKELENLVYQTMNQVETSTTPKPKNPTMIRGSKREEDARRDNQGRGWRISLQAVSIATRAGYAYGHLFYQDLASTDRVQTRIHGFRAGEAAVATGLSLIPVAGPWLASGFSFAEQIVTKRITNGIQRRGDAKRIAYNFANYDLGKYGTYAYDNTSQEWIAQDANKVKARTLGQKQSV